MDKSANLDWESAKLFVAVVEAGSLSAAARKTGTSQPTMGRAVSRLEQSLGVSLFRRVPRGLELTETGLDLFPHAKAMADAAARLSLAAEGKAGRLEGPVRITASQIVATYALPEILARLRSREPGIDIEIVASDSTDNLLFREADIAVRMFRPEQEDLIAKQVGAFGLGLFAHRAYLDRRGRPETFDDLFCYDVIGYDRSTLMIDRAKEIGYVLSRDFFAFRCDDQSVCWHLLRTGAGIGFAPFWLAGTEQEIEPLLDGQAMATLPVWLVSHKELRMSGRVRRVYDFLAEELKNLKNGD